MKITRWQYRKIADCFPQPRGNVKYSNLQVLNGILYILENGCKWRAIPKEFGPWHTVYDRMRRWVDAGVLAKVFEKLQREHVLPDNLHFVALDRVPSSKSILTELGL
jgi:transposase